MNKNATPTASQVRSDAITSLLRLRVTQPDVEKVKLFAREVASSLNDIVVEIPCPDFLVPDYDGYEKSLPKGERKPIEVTCHMDKKLDWGEDEDHRIYLYTDREGKVLLGYVDVKFSGKVVVPDLPTGVTVQKMESFPSQTWKNFVEMELSATVKPRQVFASVVDSWWAKAGWKASKTELDTLAAITRYSA